MTDRAPATLHSSTPPPGERGGIALVLGSAIVWSFGGAIARYLDIADNWTVVFWRCLFAGVFLIGFMLLRDGPRGTIRLFRGMGWPGLTVGIGFAIASTCFIIAINHTTVANVVLLQAGVPLFAALIAWIFFREPVSTFTWATSGLVIFGVAIMVSGSLGGTISPLGDALALMIAVVFAITTVITRRYTHVRMTPAACFGALIAAAVAASQSSGLAVTLPELGLLFIFGAVNLGLGMALFVTGARLLPAALAALLGTAETMLGPVWVALLHGEVPQARTVIGGVFILVALMGYLMAEMHRQSRPMQKILPPVI